MQQTFFDESTEQSQVKALIVAKYFWSWAKVIIPAARKRSGKIAYIDLFAGPGRYQDGTQSTPLLVLERAINDPQIREMLIAIFNDKDAANSRSLREAIGNLPDINKLRYEPIVYNEEVGERIVHLFETMRLVPTLFFVDPWGYKGLSLRLINSVLKNWGCDALFFFNYNRINMGLPNEYVEEHMNALFEKDRADRLRSELVELPPAEKELAIVEAISQALKDMGGRYVLPFRFRSDSGARTSHHLVFVSKHVRGYEIMKDIMARESTSTEQGVPSFEYNPARQRQGLLFELSRPLDDLCDRLLAAFTGQKLTMQQVYEQHHVDTPYLKKNYKDALLKLEQDGTIKATPTAAARRKNTFADDVTVIFPPKR
jgi:three-Cys-motif partner protein